MMRKLNLIPLLIIPALTTAFVLREEIVKTPWSGPPKTAATLPPVETFRITSTHTGATYGIIVQLPHDYSDQGDRYPVMFVLQGVPSDYSYDEVIAPLLRKRRIPDIIFVSVTQFNERARSLAAILNRAREARPLHTWADDLTRHADPEDPTEGGGSEAFTAFIEKELIPKIDSTYHTDRADRGLGGVGLGGLFVVDTSFRRPGLFKRAIAIAPRVGFANYALIEDLRAMEHRRSRRPDTRLYIGGGAEDHRLNVQGFEILRDTLEKSPSGLVELKAELLRGRGNQDQYVPAVQKGLAFVYKKKD